MKLNFDTFDNKFLKIKNTFQGQSCYIFGNGPSIKWFNLKNFSNLPSIVVGQLHYHIDFKHLDVKVCCLVEPWIFIPSFLQSIFDKHSQHRKHLQSIKPIIKDYKLFMKSKADSNFIVSLSNFPYIRGKNIFYVNKRFPNISGFENKIEQFNVFGGSFYAALSTAYMMGFKHVYLIGFDAWTITPTRNIRYYEKGKGKIEQNTPKINEMINFFKHQMNISVILHEGRSQNFKMIKYYDFFGERPKYNENTVIIGKEYLKMLSTINDYKIY
jgi:hypothetical protein